MVPTNVVITAPAEWPVSLSEVKRRSFIVDDASADTLLRDIIPPAIRFVENLAKRSLITQTRTQTYDYQPCSPIYLRYGPVQSITSFTYVDSNGDSQTLASTYYEFQTNRSPARLQQTYNQTWPSIRGQLNTVVITYVAGYGMTPASVPAIYRNAIIVLCKHWYDNPDAFGCEDADGVIGRLESMLAIEGRTLEYA